MDIQAHLENLRSKPEHIRRRFAFWTSFGITALIFAFWISSFTSSVIPNTNVAETVDKAGSPGRSLIAGVGAFIVDIKELIFGAKKVTFSSVEVGPGLK